MENKIYQDSQNEQAAGNQNYARTNNYQPEVSDQQIEPHDNNSGSFASDGNQQNVIRDKRVNGIKQRINDNRAREREMSDNPREPGRGGQSRGGQSRSRGQQDRGRHYEDNSYEDNDNYNQGNNQRNGGRNQRREDSFDDARNNSVDSADRDNQVTERNPTSNRNQQRNPQKYNEPKRKNIR